MGGRRPAARRRRGPGPLLLPLLLGLAACATPGLEAPRPADYPDHVERGMFDLHWRLERGSGEARAVGLVTTKRNAYYALTLQLVALDDGGRVVNRGLAFVSPRDFTASPSPFTIRMTLRGAERRFEIGILTEHQSGLRGGR